MFGYERESDDDTIIDNYDYSSSDISMPSDVTVDSDSDSHSEGENDTDNNNNKLVIIFCYHIKYMFTHNSVVFILFYVK